MDYARPEVWDELAERLAHRHAPRPTRRSGWVQCEPGWSWQPRMRDYDLWMVLGGRGRGRVGADEFALRAGTLVMFRPGDRGSFRQDPDDRLTVAFCHFDFFDPAAPGQRVEVSEKWLPSRTIPVTDVALLADVLGRVVRLCQDTHPLGQLECSAAFLAAMVEVYRQDASASGHQVRTVDPRLHRVVDMVRTQPGRRLSLEDAAAVAELSPAHFSRLFSAHLGKSFRRYTLEARLARAHHLLTETTMSVADVSRALGYNDPFLFSRQFRTHYGQPPSQVRRLNS
jgi:AraC-like DNA-binding protein